MRSLTRFVLAAVAVVLTTACHGGAAGRASMSANVPAAGTRDVNRPAALPATAARAYAEEDVRFMQRMLMHHQQALAMTGLVLTHSRSSDVRIMSLRLDLTRRDQGALIRYWLENRGERVPSTSQSDASMPGMLGRAQLDSLDKATGPAFDELFLRYLADHHAGALVMVTDHQRTPGASRQPETARLVSDIEAELRADIHRARTLLAAAR